MIQYEVTSLIDYIKKARKKKARDVRDWEQCDTVGLGKAGLILCNEWIRDLFEPVDGAEQCYCGPTEHSEP
jgi:hypothetical protein